MIIDTRANSIAKKLGKKNSRKCWNWAPKTRHQKHEIFVTFLCVQRVLHWIIVLLAIFWCACVHVNASLYLRSPILAARAQPHVFAARSSWITGNKIWWPEAHSGPGRGTPILKLIYLSTLRERMNGKRFAVKNKTVTPVAQHFNTSEHSLKISVVQAAPTAVVQHRLLENFGSSGLKNPRSTVSSIETKVWT